ncbi:hypothetical protein HETIRDRAFT_471078 [Heterobasidion irregulare TC 32-1]|uniref:Alpha N-terminal protein methyltransferase 1 n=1 Tax=Heterobasidion irregulare (strain TC 32-1) TaxID=747525 RepID=W4KJK0_HETIT|nr:uncharacterized protein HETIRDRAFT_471078 [Heterobasidion irregulare TC 32-1]ETW85869.1 hypothetical protein HETIRDRAFT_471078 [Heterobasidion irregulare TC 32-1]
MARVQAIQAEQEPGPDDGINYWRTQPASYDGVLGGFGKGSLPRVETLGSRQFLMHLFPELCTVPSAVRPLRPKPKARRTRALDVGAGIGRVTADTLLHLFDDVVILEPVDDLVREAYARGTASDPSSATHAPRTQQGDSGEPPFVPWKGIADNSKSVAFFQGGLQTFDPANPTKSTDVIGRVGFVPEVPTSDLDSGFDVVWCQWCLMYLSDTDLVAFLKRSKPALRDPKRSVIVVKENLCSDGEYNTPITIFDQEDSSVTRSDLAFKRIFEDAGLTVVHEQVQQGLPEGLFVVKMYALR